MDINQGYDQSAEHIHNPDVDHESSDINVRGVFGFGAGLVICTLLVCFVLYGMFDLLRRQFTTEPSTSTSMVGTREPREPGAPMAQTTFPEPRLQTDYFKDLAAVRKGWEVHLNSYGWLDQNAGVVHIPIERAMELTLQHGLPARPSAEQNGAAEGPAPTQPATAKTTGTKK